MRNDGRPLPPGEAPPPRKVTELLRPTRLPLPVAEASRAAPAPSLAAAEGPPVDSDGHPDLSGRLLGNWRLQRRLGAGSFGVVYEGQNASIVGRLAAIKVLHPHLSLQPEIKRRFINEASAASRAEHENIVQVFDGGITEDNICYVVMELLKGSTLRQQIDGGRLEPARAVRIARQVAFALSAAHREGIVHRDLKPDNVFLAQRSENPEFVKVLDFGIAKLAADAAGVNEMYKTRSGMWLGTPAYMSPEQWQTLPDIDPRADIYALGVILFEMLTGKAPFTGATQFMVMMGHLNEPVPSACDVVPGLLPSLGRLAVQMMEKRREERPPSMTEVADELSRIADVLAGVPAADTRTGREALFDTAPALGAMSLSQKPVVLAGRGSRPVARAARLSTPPLTRPEAPPLPRLPRSVPSVVMVDELDPEALRKQIDRDPYRIDPYRHLHQLCLARGDTDGAWCTAAALVYLQRANPEEEALFERHRSARPPVVNRPLRDDAWEKHLMHGDEDPTVGAIFAAIAQPGAMLRAASHRQLGLKRANRIDALTHPSTFATAFATAARVLHPIVPDVYLRADQQGGIKIANCRDGNVLCPTLLVGHDVLGDSRAVELAFRVGRLLTLFRPERYLKLIYASSLDLRTIFLSGLKIAQPTLTVGGPEAPQVAQNAQKLGQSLSNPIRELLAKAALGLPRAGVEVYLARWSQAVELTAHRAGLLLCNDLTIAARLIENEPAHGTGLQTDRVGELLRYAVSAKYLELRRQLGIAMA